MAGAFRYSTRPSDVLSSMGKEAAAAGGDDLSDHPVAAAAVAILDQRDRELEDYISNIPVNTAWARFQFVVTTTNAAYVACTVGLDSQRGCRNATGGAGYFTIDPGAWLCIVTGECIDLIDATVDLPYVVVGNTESVIYTVLTADLVSDGQIVPSGGQGTLLSFDATQHHSVEATLAGVPPFDAHSTSASFQGHITLINAGDGLV